MSAPLAVVPEARRGNGLYAAGSDCAATSFAPAAHVLTAQNPCSCSAVHADQPFQNRTLHLDWSDFPLRLLQKGGGGTEGALGPCLV